MAIDLPILLRAYSLGMFPMADDRRARSIFWVEPEMRAIMPIDGFHLSRSLRKVIRSDRFEVTRDTAFEQVIALCAASATDRPSTWINQDIEEAFIRLHHCGLAHSVEVWSKDDGEKQLVGGLYGLALGRAFFGESMFSRATDASKVAMAWLVARLKVGGYRLLDCQFMTEHLASLGAIEISAEDYSGLLGAAVGDGAAGVGAGGAGAASFEALDSLVADEALLPPLSGERSVSGPVSGHVIAQLITQTS